MVAGLRCGVDDPGGAPGNGFGSRDMEIERVGHFVERIALAAAATLPFRKPALALLRSLVAAQLNIRLEFLLLMLLFLGAERLIVARHQAAVGRAFLHRD